MAMHISTSKSRRFLSVGAYELPHIPAKNESVDPVAVWYSGCFTEVGTSYRIYLWMCYNIYIYICSEAEGSDFEHVL